MRVYLTEVPVESGGRLLVQVCDAELAGDLRLASAVTLAWKRPGPATDGG